MRYAAKSTMPCPKCKDGIIPHVKRKIGPTDNKIDDPSDFQTEETCDKCGGSGRIPLVAGEIKENTVIGGYVDEYSSIYGDCA